MSPRTISELVLREAPVLAVTDSVETAVRRVLESGLPALPAAAEDGRYAGIFGEREFMEALFPGYLKQLKHAAFLPRSLDEALDRRESCRGDAVGRYLNREHVEVGPDVADVQLAEIFLHHRVLVIPVVDDGRVRALVTRRDFFRVLAERFVGGG
jgi:CBS domain-containing protein